MPLNYQGIQVKSLLIVISLVALALPAQADDGQSLLTQMNNSHTNNETKYQTSAYVQGYIAGVMDAHDKGMYCLPARRVSTGTVVSTVEDYLNSHPKQLHKTASYLVTVALAESWPCPTKDKTK